MSKLPTSKTTRLLMANVVEHNHDTIRFTVKTDHGFIYGTILEELQRKIYEIYGDG